MVLTKQEKAVIAIVEKARNEIAKLGYKPTAKHCVSNEEDLRYENTTRVFEACLTVSSTDCLKFELESPGDA